MNHLFVEIRLLTLYCYLALCSTQAMQLATTSSTTTTTSSATTTITITSTITSNTSHHLIPATTTTTTTTTNVQTELPLIQPASISTATASTSSQEPQPPPQAQPQPRPTEPTTTPETTNSQPPPTEQQQQLQPQQPYCTLGDDTYQIGERWNPNLPPFGVQVCVLCECTVRQRKSCYEAKVTCRRITNECPIIDSCPDGKKPVTVAGQCCKSCQSTSLSSSLSSSSSSLQEQAQSIGNQSPAYESQPQLKPAPLSTSFRIVYMNERTKDYMSLVKNLPACPMRDSDSSSASSGGPTTTKPPSPPQLPQQVSPSLLLLPTTQAPMQAPSASKAAKANRNDLNGIDTRMAFKSLHDAASNYIGSSKSRHSSSSSTFSSDASAAAVNYNQQHEGSAPRRFDHSSDDHQHPNDVQSATASNRNQQQLHHHHSSANYGSVGSGGSNSRQSSSSLSSSLANSCKLGNDTFQVGDVWNPILPPHGVQVCVQCNCIFRVRKGCFETKVTCRRINRDCPNLEVCPDGNPPINVDGQCCKTCPMSIGSNTDNQQDEQQQQREQLQQQSDGSANLFQPTTLPLNGIMRNEKVFREFNASTRNLNLCVKSKESVDIYNTNRYARRAQRQALTTPRHTSNNNK